MQPQPEPNATRPAPRPGRRWRVVLFFAVWTVFAVVTIWGLTNAAARRPGVLIEVERGTADSALARLREWCQANVELDWAYPWLLFAPYVLWLGTRLRLDQPGLPLRASGLLAAGAVFVAGSQAVTRRLTRHEPRAVTITASTTFRETELNFTNRARMMILAGHPRQITSHLVFSTNLPPVKEGDALAWEIAENVRPIVEQLRGVVPPLMTRPTPAWAYALDALAYLCLVGLAQVVQVRRHLREREQQAARLEGRLNQARLRTLQAQLQPHFLFNALNGIAALIRSQPRVAEEMVTSLSELLRLALSQSDRQTIPLRQELEFLDRYLEIQQMRFGDRLRVERDIAPDTLDCLVPSLLLQPLVENAVRHGLEPAPYAGKVRIAAAAADGRLQLSVTDNGVGLSPAAAAAIAAAPASEAARSPGLGLASVRERLAALYGNEHEFQLRSRTEGGVEVRVRIPLQPGGPVGSRSAP
jgi:signal transduction histidine kinase